MDKDTGPITLEQFFKAKASIKIQGKVSGRLIQTIRPSTRKGYYMVGFRNAARSEELSGDTMVDWWRG